MKKKFVVVVLALVMLVSLTTPVMANNLSDIEAALRELAGDRIGAAGLINEAIDELSQEIIQGNEVAIYTNLRNAINEGRVGGTPGGATIAVNDLTATQLGNITNYITTAMNLIDGFNLILPMTDITQGNIDPDTILRNMRLYGPDGRIWPPLDRPVPPAAAGDAGVAAAAADNVIRQTGFSADYSVLLLVAAVLSIMLVAAIIFSIRLRLRFDGAR